jgi:hypothetical protein
MVDGGWWMVDGGWCQLLTEAHQAEAGGWAPSSALQLTAGLGRRRPGLSGLGSPAPCRTSSSPRSAP